MEAPAGPEMFGTHFENGDPPLGVCPDEGTESFCCEECMDMVIAGGVKVTFHRWESPNGTNESRGQ
eukprot:scaffold12056_cov21-Tisochrysis_lutea.AAC.1